MKTFNELLELINQGEKYNFECKKVKGGLPSSLFETYSAFANTDGGIIVLGIEEDKNKSDNKERYILTGITNPKKMLKDFWNTLNSKKS